MDIAGVGPATWLTFSVIGAFVSTIGTVAGIFIRDWWLAGNAERRAERTAVQKLIRDSSEPLILSGRDLVRRLNEINQAYPPDYLVTKPHSATPLLRAKSARIDGHFNDYKRRSTLYRFASFLGWIECFRAEMSFGQLSSSEFARQFNQQLHHITKWMSDGTLNPNWENDRDCLVYREEIRAIGECMLVHQGNASRVMGYAKFHDEMDLDSAFAKWIGVLDQFLGELLAEGDFRKTRLTEIQNQIEGMCSMLREFQAKSGK